MPALTDQRPAKAAPGARDANGELLRYRPKAAMTFPEDHIGELDLADRHALRRVAGLSTELTDITEVEYRALRLERVVLIGVWTEGTLAGAENSLRELSRLAETAGSVVLDGLVQRRGRPDSATYIGAGKAAELAALVTATGADTVTGGGGIGTRGPGETKIETDRRRIRARTAKLRRQIAEMSVGREVQRGRRRRREVPAVAIAGYTNAGKSSLLNRLTGAGVLVDDSLFATLDPSVRRARTSSGRWFTLTDTVGFVRRLPHQLVDAFRSTLEEVAQADLVLHVVDGSDADPQAQMSAVREVLAEIGAADVPEIVVINKADTADPVEVKGLQAKERDCVVVSALTGSGIDDLLATVDARLPRRDREVSVLVPYGWGDLAARAHQEGEVLAVRHAAEGSELTARGPAGLEAERTGVAGAPVAAARRAID